MQEKKKTCLNKCGTYLSVSKCATILQRIGNRSSILILLLFKRLFPWSFYALFGNLNNNPNRKKSLYVANFLQAI